MVVNISSFGAQRPVEVQARLNKKEAVTVLDVRELDEWLSGHIPGATHIPLGDLPQRHQELGKGREIIVVCHSGGRSKLACEWLSELGYKVTNMTGGMSQWAGKVVFHP